MQDNGWIKLHRCLLDKAVWQCLTEGQRVVMITILLLAGHEERHWMWKGNKYDLQPGQFITSRGNLAKKAGVSVQTVRGALENLEKLEFITKETTKSNTLITVLNWDVYQEREEKNNPTNNQRTTNKQPTNNQRTTTNKNDKNVKNDKKYTAEFERAWNAYPRKEDKARSYECYKARLNEGYSEEELIRATEKYADACKTRKTELRYIKKAYTFWGVNTPFLDYMPKAPGINTAKIFDLAEQQNAPYFGFPPEWFDGETLIRDRVVAVTQPADPSRGLYEDEEVPAEELIDRYEIRRKYYAEHK